MTTNLNRSEVSELIHQAHQGRTTSLAKLLETYRSYAILLGRLQIPAELRAKLSASDLVQEAFICAQEAFAGFRGTTEAELLAWLRRILASQLSKQLRHYRAQKRGRPEEQLEAAMLRSSQAMTRAFQASGPSPSQQAARREEAVVLADVLAALSPEYREVLVLRHLEGHDFPTIARTLDRELENVKSLWRRALSQLQRQVNRSMN